MKIFEPKSGKTVCRQLPEPNSSQAELLKVSSQFGVSVDHLLGIQERPRNGCGPTGKLRRVFEEVSYLPRYRQQRVIAIIEDMIVAQRAKA